MRADLPDGRAHLLFLAFQTITKFTRNAMGTSPTTHAGPLGESIQYQDGYDASLLHPMARSEGRHAVGLDGVQIAGEDQWTAYEFSWLNHRGKPQAAELSFTVPASSSNIIESKSMKLYLNGFSQTQFETPEALLKTLKADLSDGFESDVEPFLAGVTVMPGDGKLPGQCLDDLDIDIDVYQYTPDLLVCEDAAADVELTVHSHVFRSLCPVTGQPDWASVAIDYQGAALQPESLLRYLVSYRNHQAFHETTIERIYADIWQCCEPKRLSVYGRFLRRGGIDINPYRSSHGDGAPRIRVARQ